MHSRRRDLVENDAADASAGIRTSKRRQPGSSASDRRAFSSSSGMNSWARPDGRAFRRSGEGHGAVICCDYFAVRAGEGSPAWL
jgi:hypothetical protein